MSVDAVLLVLLWLCAPAAALYALLYAFRPWRSTQAGTALMLKSVGTAMLLVISLLYVWLGDYWGRDAIRVAAFALWTVGIYYLLWTLLTSPGAEKYPPRSWFRRRR